MGARSGRWRWRVFLVALGASAALAAGFGLAIAGLASRTQPAPQLATVPARTLPQAGIRVAAANQPPYCDLERGAAERRWISAGVAGCAITRPAAEAALLPGFQGTVQEAVLARVSAESEGSLGHDRLVWMLVVRSSLLLIPPSGCGATPTSGPACAVRGAGAVTNRAVVLVDATTGEVITAVPVPPT